MTTPAANIALDRFTRYQKFVVAMLSFLQFTIILDFMILAPLGALLMPALNITPAQFGLVVAAYAFSAGISGVLAAGFADRFDRKKLLLFFYSGFILGTLFCGLAPNYHFLLAARVVTGLFGGVIGSIVGAISIDIFPYHMRGRVMGFVQTAFAASQVMGLPLGLYLGNKWGWHSPFIMIVVVSAFVGLFIWRFLKPVNEHLDKPQDTSAFRHLYNTVTRPRYLQAFATTSLLATGGFMMMPFASAFSVNNLGIRLDELPWVYMVVGVSSMIAGPIIGRISDAAGKLLTFIVGSTLTIVMVLIYTRLGVTPIWMVMILNSIMFMGISSRIISSSALISAIPDAVHRGSFMSVSSSVQQVSGGFASVLAGLIVIQTTAGPLERFDRLGDVVCAATVITMVMMYFIDRRIRRERLTANH